MIFIDTVKMSLNAIRSNKLRSGLTLFGIILGVASIIGVMTSISVVQKTMEREMTVLGTQTFQVQKWPNGFSSDEQRRAAMKWPPVTLEEAQAIREQVQSVDLVGTEFWDGGKVATFNGYSTEPMVALCGGSPEYAENNTHFIANGRNISRMDMAAHRRVVVLGSALAEELFPFSDPIGQQIRVDGRKYEVIGTFVPKESAFGGPYQTLALIPGTTYTQIYGLTDGRGFERSANVTLHAITPELLPDAIEETRQVLRRMRNIKYNEPDNFYYFTSLSQIDQFNESTKPVKIGAFVMGTVALIVAGVGIMNIMLVSVTERTKEIGIRKSLGAKRHNILTQFLIEAVVLCNVGGIIGILIGFGLGNIISAVAGFDANIPYEWALFGMGFCSFIGVTFGMIPAIKASKLNPIQALFYE
ncbi:MAG: FtsX-like permease family protein [Paraglaciecola sp.]|nr:FtsX-like permease family protein [Paraglaciecola sp.]NCT49150.1 FtsX-like permease family protein [Paraglaciecola sp.]